MEITILIFLLGGLFLGWSLGANDAANVFGTAVGTRMVSFGSAAIVCSVFVILGAIISGGGTTETLGKLGAINALPGAFAACVAAGISVYLMTKVGLPVSTTQAIVGAIVGWNLYTGSSTNIQVLITILATWILCPIIAGVIAMGLFTFTKKVILNRKLHILRLDAYTRTALLLAGAFGAYSLGAKKIIIIRTYEKNFIRTNKIENYVAALFMSKYPNLSKALLRHSKTYNNCLNFIKNPPADCQIVEICPPMRLKVKRDTIDHNLLKEGYQIGVKSAEEFLRLNSNLFY